MLIGACRDGTDLGLRDEALIRLGLAGMRAAEIIHLRVVDLRLHDSEPRIEWIGKKRRAPRIVPGPALVAMLDALLFRREELLRRTAAGLLHRSIGPDGSHHFDDSPPTSNEDAAMPWPSVAL